MPLGCSRIRYSDLKVEQELGSGGFGVVYKATWREEAVAVKQLHSTQLTAVSSKAFMSEAETMAKLNSTRLVRLFGVTIAPDPYCLVMEYMAKGSLHALLHSEEQYGWQISLQMVTDIGNGIAFLHQEKILHRDLKSLNVLINQQYRAKIADFGLSQIRHEVSTTTKTPTAVGTNSWMAPELFGIKPKYSFASDIYAYGIILWEMLTRESPYKDVLDPNEVKMAVKSGEREDIPDTCPPAYRATIEHCWAQKPEDRPPAALVVTDLQQQLAVAQDAAIKSWHIEPALKPKARTAAGFQYIAAGEYDKRKVIEAYERCPYSPIPGMEVGSVTIIFNPELNATFANTLGVLERRYGNPAFDPHWSTGGKDEPLPPTAQETAWRSDVAQRFTNMTAPYQDPDAPHVKILPVWHGTKRAIVESIAKTGFANLATSDTGFFGKAVYGAFEAKYAYQVYGPGKLLDDGTRLGANGVLLINWIACYAAYPVIAGDMGKLAEKGNYANYDAHFVPVRLADPTNPDEINFYPCAAAKEVVYHELAVFGNPCSQALPRYIVELRKKTVPPAMPPAGPPIAAAPPATKSALMVVQAPAFPTALAPLSPPLVLTVQPPAGALAGNPNSLFAQQKAGGAGTAQAQQAYYKH